MAIKAFGETDWPAGNREDAAAKRDAERELRAFIQEHGAETTIVALSRVLAGLGPDWSRVAEDVEGLTGITPYAADDWRQRAAQPPYTGPLRARLAGPRAWDGTPRRT